MIISAYARWAAMVHSSQFTSITHTAISVWIMDSSWMATSVYLANRFVLFLFQSFSDGKRLLYL